MPEPDLIRQQREILRTFRQANARRAQAEADAEARRKQEREAADAALSQTRRTADAALAEARKAQESAQDSLSQAGLSNLLQATRPTPTALHPGADPAQQLTQAAAVAAAACKDVQGDVAALLQWREAVAIRTGWLRTVGAVATVAVIIVIILSVQVAQKAAVAEATRQAEQRAEATRQVLAEATRQAEQRAEATRQVLAEAAIKAGPVLVPAGEFLMGSADADSGADSDEKPQRKVYLDAFKIDRTEVTNAMYAKCVQAGACRTPASSGSGKKNSYYGDSQYANYPVIHVSWNDAQAYCMWAGGRLPTEAEWEKAARGADGRTYPWGNEPPDKQRCNFNRDVGDTTPVGVYPAGASPYGALDMAGNVWEWVADRYQADYYAVAPARNPPGPAAGDSRVLRGGSWGCGQWLVRAAGRDRNDPVVRNVNLGFRCARGTSP